MDPQRKQWVNGVLVEQYYWSGELCVYVDHIAVEGTYEEAVARVKLETSTSQ